MKTKFHFITTEVCCLTYTPSDRLYTVMYTLHVVRNVSHSILTFSFPWKILKAGKKRKWKNQCITFNITFWHEDLPTVSDRICRPHISG